MTKPSLTLLAVAFSSSACSGGPAVHAPVCTQWTPQVRQAGGALRVLGAAPNGDQHIQLLMQNNAAMQHVMETSQEWQTTDLDISPQLDGRGGMALDANQAPTLVYGVQTPRYATRGQASSAFEIHDLPVAGPVVDVGVQSDLAGTVHVVVVGENGAALSWVRFGQEDVEVERVPLPAAAFTQGPLGRAALALLEDGRSWVFVANDAAIWAGARSANGVWTAHHVQALDAQVLELGAVVDAPGSVQLLVRAAARGHGFLKLIHLLDSPDNATSQALDSALPASTPERLLAVGLDAERRVRILHARTPGELVQTVLADGEVLRETVELPKGATITGVTAVLGPAHTWLVETHRSDSTEQELVTHRCE